MFQENATSKTLIGLLRESSWTMRSIASVVLLTFGGLVTSPAVAAVAQEVKQIEWHKSDATNAAKLSKKVEETHTFLTKLALGDAKRLDFSASHEQLRSLKADLASLDKGAMDDFATNEAHIKAHNLPAVIEERQLAAVKTYRSRMDTLMAELNAADTAKDAAGFLAHVNAAKTHLDKVQVKPFHEKFDPKNLPFSVAKATGTKPRLSKKDYQARPVAPAKRAQVASNGSLAGILTAADVSGALPTNPADPSYVAATDDIQITPAIQAQATALNHDPVQIYNWVHNNIEYIPTYGSIQGSDMTLQTLKGNDFDQASLLIGLLRASNIPSRYVYGTIQVPIAQVENWVGGVTDPNAALNLMSQGGVPVTGVVQGGQIKYAQLEHVWVEAWVDFIPSRAAKSGAGNTWVPMDGSFKQFLYTPGTNLAQQVPLNLSTAATQVVSGATINTTQGWASNFNTPYILQQAAGYQQQVSVYVSNLEASNPKATVGDIVGTKAIVAVSRGIISSTLPYNVIAIGQRIVQLPDALEWKFSYQLIDGNGSSVLSYTASTPQLAGQLLALSFTPATPADAEAALAMLPAVQSGGVLDPSQLPLALPGYLINVLPQVVVNGQVMSNGAAYPIGSDLQAQQGYWSPQSGWQLKGSDIVAGEYHAVATALQGVSDRQIQSIESSMQNTQAAIGAGSITNLTGHDVVGTILQSGVWSYFYVNNSQDLINQRLLNVVEYPLPSFGTFKLTAQPVYNFGIAQSVRFPGVTMDIANYSSMAAAKDNSHESVFNYFSSVGPRLSAYEHQIPEELFSTAAQPIQSISAVRALSLAASGGQQIYTIDASNVDTALPALTVGTAVESDIQSAVNAGMTVTVSQNPVSSGGWEGTGYIIQDPTTGTGAYKISGNANGSVSILGTFGVLAIMALFAFTLVASLGALPVFIAIMGLLWTANTFGNRVEAIAASKADPEAKLLDLQQAEFTAQLSGALSLIGLAGLGTQINLLRGLLSGFLSVMANFFLP